MSDVQTGYAAINGAEIYYEIAGQGHPLVFVHAGVADSRMWDEQFQEFAKYYRTVRLDMRGFGNSKPVDGEYANREDIYALLKLLNIDRTYLIGCSMGGGACMDLTLEYPELTAALVMVGSGPTGLKLDVPPSAKFAQAQQADEAKDWELLNELEVQIWFDGEGRTPDQVDAKARVLALDMNRRALDYAAQNRGKHKPQMQPSAAERLADLHLPVLIVYGDRDVAYIQHAADYMFQHIPGARKVLMPNTAHLPNMERPIEFNQIVLDFLQKLS